MQFGRIDLPFTGFVFGNRNPSCADRTQDLSLINADCASGGIDGIHRGRFLRSEWAETLRPLLLKNGVWADHSSFATAVTEQIDGGARRLANSAPPDAQRAAFIQHAKVTPVALHCGGLRFYVRRIRPRTAV